jgi:hypothetical protein
MKKSFLIALIGLLASFALPSLLMADRGWQKFDERQGVEMFSRVTKELDNQYRTELFFFNRNYRPVVVEYDALLWNCRAGGTDRYVGAIHRIPSRGEVKGQWAGLLYYPCRGRTRDAWSRFSIQGMRVTFKDE